MVARAIATTSGSPREGFKAEAAVRAGGSGGSLGPTIPARGSNTASRRLRLSCRTQLAALQNAKCSFTGPLSPGSSRWAWRGSTPSRRGWPAGNSEAGRGEVCGIGGAGRSAGGAKSWRARFWAAACRRGAMGGASDGAGRAWFQPVNNQALGEPANRPARFGLYSYKPNRRDCGRSTPSLHNSSGSETPPAPCCPPVPRARAPLALLSPPRCQQQHPGGAANAASGPKRPLPQRQRRRASTC